MQTASQNCYTGYWNIQKNKHNSLKTIKLCMIGFKVLFLDVFAFHVYLDVKINVPCILKAAVAGVRVWFQVKPFRSYFMENKKQVVHFITKQDNVAQLYNLECRKMNA